MSKTKKQKLFGVVYMDHGDSCDHRIRSTEKLYKTLKSAQKNMKADIDTYLKADKECGIKSKLEEIDDTYARVGNYERGCEWYITDF